MPEALRVAQTQTSLLLLVVVKTRGGEDVVQELEGEEAEEEAEEAEEEEEEEEGSSKPKLKPKHSGSKRPHRILRKMRPVTSLFILG